MLRKLLAFILLLPSGVAFAHEPAEPAFNVINLQAQSTREVENDLLQATLYVELEDRDTARLADSINRTIQQALHTAGEYKAIKVKTGNYQTFPVYDKKQIVQWRARHEIHIESGDFSAATSLIGKLQASMQLAGLSFSVSPGLRQKSENSLITDAVGAFRLRADVIRTSLKASSYKIQTLNINTSEGYTQPGFSLRTMAAVPAQVTPPETEAGTSRITVTVSGTIQLE